MAYAPDAPRCCACGMPGPLHNLRFSSRHITSAPKSRCHNCSDVVSREKSDKPRAPRARSDGVRDFFVYVKHLRQQSGLSAELTVQWVRARHNSQGCLRQPPTDAPLQPLAGAVSVGVVP